MARSNPNNQVPFWQPLTVRSFLLLFIGENISLLGNQFYLVALPWLTIQLTDSGVSLGTVLMAAAIPRAALLLLGGVVSDRSFPRIVMITSNALRALVTILLTTIVAIQAIQVWHLYLFSVCFGILEGFFIPASKAIVPSLVKKELLVASNTLIQGTNQLILTLGPVIGGLLIATVNIESAFAIDAATFIFTTIVLFFVKGSLEPNIEPLQAVESSTQKNLNSSSKIENLMAGIREGINYGWHNLALRTVLLVVMVYNLTFIGPLQIGVTSLAHNRFPGGAVALGVMNSAWGGGGLLGALAPSLLRNIPRIGILMLIIGTIQGASLMFLGFVPNVVLASLTIVVLGFCTGFFIVTEITWIQKRTPPEILGRVMSLRMLSSFGIAPFSYALAGLLVDLNLTILFSLTSCIILILMAWLAANPSIRALK
ncbi:MAG: MFS transporter [Xenococcaceae cyanobacterium MO_188.B29]|nr:MFS transporter [Xenococcaceae cyanobacterium MO_188.B29]